MPDPHGLSAIEYGQQWDQSDAGKLPKFRHTVPKHVNPIVSKLFAFLKIPELGCQDCLDVFRVRGKDYALASYRSLYRVWILSGLAYPNEGVVAELEAVISGDTGPELNKKGQACADSQRQRLET